MQSTGRLDHGGIMVNYACTAACRHCLYACSPSRGKGAYLSAEKAREIAALLREGGCPSVHIGGGEPFLDFEGLVAVIRELRTAGIELAYIETNAYWANGPQVDERLRALLDEGAGALCISFDPYHAEYVPPGYPLRLAGRCAALGMDHFIWKEGFRSALSRVDGGRAHSRAELEKALGPRYVRDTARAYNIHPGGRAINIEAEYEPAFPAEALLEERAAHTPCGNLLSTGHFHVDAQGFFIPPGCTGLRLPLAEALRGVSADKYPVFQALYTGGLAALYGLAADRGFSAGSAGYPSRCALCFHLRRFLAKAGRFPELDAEYYDESLRYYER